LTLWTIVSHEGGRLQIEADLPSWYDTVWIWCADDGYGSSPTLILWIIATTIRYVHGRIWQM
jgi:hypothetical protein